MNSNARKVNDTNILNIEQMQQIINKVYRKCYIDSISEVTTAVCNLEF